jgi:hypothetical protein
MPDAIDNCVRSLSGEFFTQGNPDYQVPELQRGYVWEEEHVKQLVRSIKQHMGFKKNLYLGTVMIQSKDEKQLIVDGQQRITTLSILASILSKEDIEEKLKKKLTQIFSRKGKNGVEHERLVHNTAPDSHNYTTIITKQDEWLEKLRDLKTLEKENKKTVEKINDFKSEQKILGIEIKKIKGNKLPEGETPYKENLTILRENRKKCKDNIKVLKNKIEEINKQPEIKKLIDKIKRLKKRTMSEENKKLIEKENKKLTQILSKTEKKKLEDKLKKDGEELKRIQKEEKLKNENVGKNNEKINLLSEEIKKINTIIHQENIEKEKNERKNVIEFGDLNYYYDINEWKGFPNETNYLFRCFKTLYQEVQNLKDADPELDSFVEFILNNIEFIKVTISDENQVYRIFQSMNAFGKDLTPGELIKSEMLHMASLVNDDKNMIKEWDGFVKTLKEVQKNPNQDVVTNFFLTYAKATKVYLNDSGKEIKPGDMYSKIFDGESGIFEVECKELIDEGGTTYKTTNKLKLQKFMAKINKWAKAFVKIELPEKLFNGKLNEECVNDIIDIISINPQQSKPYLLATYMKTIGKDKRKDDEFYTYIKYISYLITRLLGTGKIEAIRMTNIFNRMTENLNKYDSDDFRIRTILMVEDYFGQISYNPKRFEKRYNDIKALKKDKMKKEIKEITGKNQDEFGRLLQDVQIENHQIGKMMIRGAEKIEQWGAKRQLIERFHNTKFYTLEHILPKKSGFNSKRGPLYEEVTKENSYGKDYYEQMRNIEVSVNKLGNFILLESYVNSAVGGKVLRGKTDDGTLYETGTIRNEIKKKDLPTLDDGKPFPSKFWGKIEYYQFHEWKYDGETYYGSHLKSTREFCKKYKDESFWSQDLINVRTNDLIKKIKKNKNWNL